MPINKLIIPTFLGIIIFGGCSQQSMQPNPPSFETSPTQETTEVSVSQTQNPKTFKSQESSTSLEKSVNELQEQKIPETSKQKIDNKKLTNKSNKNNTKLYKGSWFDIEYPENFTVSPTEPKNTNGFTNIVTDEATFTSPDKSVEFFIFSPLWQGDPIDYLTIKSTEELVSEKIKEAGADMTKSITRWVTVKAKDGSYYRSFVSIKNQVGTGSDVHHVFGIKYKNNEAYEKYREAYNAFKASLLQYSD